MNQFGWAGTIQDFLFVDKSKWLDQLGAYHLSSLNSPADQSQINAWMNSFDVLKTQLSFLTSDHPNLNNWGIIFEYELPRERGRRPDVIILGNGIIIIIECKEYSTIFQAHIDQVSAYSRDLQNYHEKSREKRVFPILLLMKTKNLKKVSHEVRILSPSEFNTTILSQIGSKDEEIIDYSTWINSEYAPLPSLVSAARLIFRNEPLPQIKRAQSAGVPRTIENLIQIARIAQSKNELHLALVTGVPGSGKTLVGIQLVYSSILTSSELEKEAIFLSGNGPLVAVLQHALKSNVFVQDVHGFLRDYGGAHSKFPREHIWVYDEAQRAWDADRVLEKRGHLTSEPEDFLKLAEKMNSWALMVALIGEGQEIHIGEEKGLAEWNNALGKMDKNWIIHCPDKISRFFSSKDQLERNNSLDLTVSLRSHLAEDVALWVQLLLEGDFGRAKDISQNINSDGFEMYLTRNISWAMNYVKDRYFGQEEKRYGLIASSKAKNLPNFGIHNEYNYTKNLRVGPWYNDPPSSFYSCCALRDVATEFSCQGLELDFPIICWGDDLLWNDASWKSRKSRKGKAKDPHRLRLNSYRVLLTRGRDGFIIFVPPEESMEETYLALKMAGVSEYKPIIDPVSVIGTSPIYCLF